MKHRNAAILHLRATALAMLCLLAIAPLSAQPTDEQLARIASLVEEGKLAEAAIRTETLLEVFPEDPVLLEIQSLLSAVPPPAAVPGKVTNLTAPGDAAVTPAIVSPPKLDDPLTAAYWIELAQKESPRFGDTEADHAYRMAKLHLTPARKGRMGESISLLDAMRSNGGLSPKLHSFFMKEVGILLTKQGAYREALDLMPKIEHHWHRRTLGRVIAEEAGPAGHVDIARTALQAAFEAQELQVAQEGAPAREPTARHSHFCELGYTASHAGFLPEVSNYLRQAASFVPAMEPSEQCFAWSFIGQIYAHAGLLDDAEKSLRAVTTGSNLTPMTAYAGWQNSIKSRVEQGDLAGARRLLTAGRNALKKARRSFKAIDNASIAQELPDSLLQPDELAALIKAERPRDAWNLYLRDNKKLRYHASSFHSILDLFIEQNDLRSAREMLTNPGLGHYRPPNDAEDIRETANTLSYARAKLAAAYLTQSSRENFETYLATLPTDPLTRYNIAVECAAALTQ